MHDEAVDSNAIAGGRRRFIDQDQIAILQRENNGPVPQMLTNCL
jgi:hypothetical protein